MVGTSTRAWPKIWWLSGWPYIQVHYMVCIPLTKPTFVEMKYIQIVVPVDDRMNFTLKLSYAYIFKIYEYLFVVMLSPPFCIRFFHSSFFSHIFLFVHVAVFTCPPNNIIIMLYWRHLQKTGKALRSIVYRIFWILFSVTISLRRVANRTYIFGWYYLLHSSFVIVLKCHMINTAYFIFHDRLVCIWLITINTSFTSSCTNPSHHIFLDLQITQ